MDEAPPPRRHCCGDALAVPSTQALGAPLVVASRDSRKRAAKRRPVVVVLLTAERGGCSGLLSERPLTGAERAGERARPLAASRRARLQASADFPPRSHRTPRQGSHYYSSLPGGPRPRLGPRGGGRSPSPRPSPERGLAAATSAATRSTRWFPRKHTPQRVWLNRQQGSHLHTNNPTFFSSNYPLANPPHST